MYDLIHFSKYTTLAEELLNVEVLKPKYRKIK